MQLEDLEKSDIRLQKLLSGMPQNIRSGCIVKKIPAGSIIVKKQEVIKFVYILTKGELRVINEFKNGSIYAFASIMPVSFVGELEVLAGESENAVTIEAVTDCIAVRLSAEDFEKWIKCDNDALMMVANILAKKLYPTSYETGNVLFNSGISKVQSYLVKYFEKKANDEETLPINRNRQQIADEIGISVKTVNRCIKKLKDEELVMVRKGKIFVSRNQYFMMLADIK